MTCIVLAVWTLYTKVAAAFISESNGYATKDQLLTRVLGDQYEPPGLRGPIRGRIMGAHGLLADCVSRVTRRIRQPTIQPQIHKQTGDAIVKSEGELVAHPDHDGGCWRCWHNHP